MTFSKSLYSKMFSKLLETDFVDTLKDKAMDSRIKENRNQYADLFEVVEKYVSENKLIISNIKMLTGEKELYIDKYIVYCINPFRHGNAMANLMAEKRTPINKGKWIQLRTGIAHKQLGIIYKNIELVEIHSICQFKNININSLIRPIKSKGFYTDYTLFIMPQEIELIDIYKKLYSPSFSKEWKKLLKIEPVLIDETNKRISGNIIGGEVKRLYPDVYTIKKIIILKLLAGSDFILIGEWAIKLIEMGIVGGALCSTSEKVQIITSYTIEKTFNLLKDFLKTVYSNPYEITYQEHDLFIPKEYRNKRFTVYIQTPCEIEGQCPVKRRAFMDIFINGTYELIPWISSSRFLKKKNDGYPKNIKIGNPYVILRFLLIDLWILRLIHSKGLMMTNVANKKINNINVSIGKIRNPNKLGGIINKSFSLDNYLGVYSNEFIYFKILLSKQRIPIYTPAVYKKEHGRYREI